MDGIPTYSGSINQEYDTANQEYDTALYERVEVIRGANGLLSGVGTPSAIVNLVRKRPGREFGASVSGSLGSWDQQRGVVNVSTPLSAESGLRSRFVVAYQDSDSFRDRYREDKTAVLAVVEGDVFSLRVYAKGFPDLDTGGGLTLLAGVGAGEDTRDSLDVYLTGNYTLFGRDHTLVLGANSYEIESVTPGYTSVASWSYQVPDVWNYDGSAQIPLR